LDDIVFCRIRLILKKLIEDDIFRVASGLANNATFRNRVIISIFFLEYKYVLWFLFQYISMYE
jgi:hypothetical protein